MEGIKHQIHAKIKNEVVAEVSVKGEDDEGSYIQRLRGRRTTVM